MSTQPTDAELKAMWQLHAADIGGIFYYARAVLAKWGTPAGAEEPFCWHWENTFNGGMGAMKKNPETLGINMSHPDYKWTALYTAPQPSPTAQAASSAVLKAIREANMQLVRTGDDACMLVPYKVATAQSADSVQEEADLPPLPDPDLRDVGTKPQDVKDFLNGYATEYARLALAARAPADSVGRDEFIRTMLAIKLNAGNPEKVYRLATDALAANGGNK